jgi:hypothetical protein
MIELAAFAAANQAESRIQQTGPICFVQSGACTLVMRAEKLRLQPPGRGTPGIHGSSQNARNGPDFADLS